MVVLTHEEALKLVEYLRMQPELPEELDDLVSDISFELSQEPEETDEDVEEAMLDSIINEINDIFHADRRKFCPSCRLVLAELKENLIDAIINLF